MKLLTENRDLLDLIAKTLIDKEKISGTEMLRLIQSVKPQLVSAEALDKVAQVIAPAKDAITGGDQLTPAPAQMSTDDAQL